MTRLKSINKKRVIQGGTALLIVAFSLTGCVSRPEASCIFPTNEVPESITQEIAIVIAPTNNFIDFDRVVEEATPELTRLLTEDSRTKLDIILADGNTKSIATWYVDFAGAITETDKSEVVEDATNILRDIAGCINSGADDQITGAPESDVLGALGLAGTSFDNDTTDKSVLVLSNGLQTSGQFDFREIFPPVGGVSDLVAKYAAGGAYGAEETLIGANVFWFGLGQTDGVVQTGFDQQSLDSLLEFWRLSVTELGGRASSFGLGSVVFSSPGSNVIKVSPIGAPDNRVCINETLDESQGFYFKPDTAIFMDDTLARRGAEEIAAKILEKNCAGTITVTGYVASGTDKTSFDANPEAGQTLSLQRAEAFKQLLVGAGITNQEVVAKGGGHGEVYDWDADENFDEDLGKKNRIVKITQ